MAIKSKGWTAIPAVKIVSFALLILLAFAFCGTVFSMARLFDNTDNQTNVDLDVVFANDSGNDLFYRSHMNNTIDDLESLLFFESEENIMAGNCLKWVERNGVWWLESSDGSRTWSHYNAGEYRVGDAFTNSNAYAAYKEFDQEISIQSESHESFDEQEENIFQKQMQLERQSLERNAINNQLTSFRNLVNELNKRNGLIYYVSKQGFNQSNVKTPDDISFFMKQPVYLVVEQGIVIAQSHAFNSAPLGEYTIYIGYTEESINTYKTYWISIQRIVIAQIAAIIALVVLACALLTALLCGAGRKRGSDAVYFNVLDKPYLDIGIGLLFLYEIAILSLLSTIIGNYGGSYIRNPDNTRSILSVIAVGVTLILAPALCYAISFAKRVKTRRWWRYTLTWRIWNAIRSACVNFARSLWAGVPLTLQVLLIVFCLFCVMLIVAAIGGADGSSAAMSFFASVALTVPMLRYARKLSKLEAGAKSVSEGRYGDISVRGGTLGKIAEYISNISAGIESAVDERLKSERLKTELITNVSHDIRTPLTSLITYTDLLKNEGLASEHAPEYLDILIQKSQRLKTLTDELFEASKASSGNIETHLERLDFAALMRQVLGELDERVQSSSLEFRTTLPEHMWVTADGKLLWRAAENLLSNVFKYSLPQSRVYIGLANEGGFARLDIKNISAEPLNMEPSELTERFKRGDDSRSGEGSGLGLSIVQSFVEAQNGRFAISIDGDLFKASVFMPEA